MPKGALRVPLVFRCRSPDWRRSRKSGARTTAAIARSHGRRTGPRISGFASNPGYGAAVAFRGAGRYQRHRSPHHFRSDRSDVNAPLKAIEGQSDLAATMNRIGAAARAAARTLAQTAAPDKERGLQAMAQAVRDAAPAILAANAEDVAEVREAGQTDAFIDRLKARSPSGSRPSRTGSTPSRPSPIPSAPSWRPGSGRTACASSGCGCRSGSSG